MAENDNGQSPNERGEIVPRPPSPPQAGPQSPDDEQRRQFEEFQRFQAYLRYTRSTGDSGVQEQLTEISSRLDQVAASQQRTERELNPPLWKKLLRSRLVHAIVGLLVIIALATWAFQHFFGSFGSSSPSSPVPPGQPGQPGRFDAAPHRPDRTVQDLYVDVAIPNNGVCNLFTPSGKRAFAHDFHASDCLDAVTKLRSQVTNSDTYSTLLFYDAIVSKTPTTATVSSCKADVKGGPRLGAFTLTKEQLGGWYISGHRPETCTAVPSDGPTPTY